MVRILASVAVLLSAVGVAACGGDGSSGAAGSGTGGGTGGAGTSGTGGVAGSGGAAVGGSGGETGGTGGAAVGGSGGGTGGTGGAAVGGSGGGTGGTGGGTGGSAGFVPESGPRSIVYPADWTPGYQTTRPGDGESVFIQDFSYAGYRNSELALPSGNFADVIDVAVDSTGATDVTAAIQSAIDQAEANPGGGIVALPAGLFRLDGPLTIEGSNVVLRGAGSDQTKLWFVDGGGISEKTALLVTGGNWLDEGEDPNWAITSDGAIFEDFVEVEDAAGISVGDDISIAWDITAEFKAEHNSSAYWYHLSEGDRRTFFRRTVTSVTGNRIHFHVPLRYPVKVRDNPVVLLASNFATGNGIEHLAISTALGGPSASWNSGVDAATAIRMRFCKDCWIQDVASFAASGEQYHLRSHGIYLERSFRVTVADSHLAKAEHLGGAGNGYLFQLSRSNEILIRDSTGREGRHNFSINWDFGSSGNVMLRDESTGGLVCGSLQDQLDGNCSEGPSDFHHALAIANLFDNFEVNDALQVGNRQDWSTGGGQTGTMNVFWHITGTGNVYAYNQGMGYVVGTAPSVSVSTDLTLTSWPESYVSLDTEPEDFNEFLGQSDTLAPLSLFEEQLARRLAQ
jgi:Pectate lyase superfamily protein